MSTVTKPKPGDKDNSTLKWVLWAMFFIVLMFAINSLFKSCNKESSGTRVKEGSKQESEIPKLTWVVDETKTIYFTGEYGLEYPIKKKVGFSFEDSTEPYCAMNTNGYFACGEKGEDISSKLPKDALSNSAFRFKSINGKSGQVNLVTWKLVKVTN